MIEELLRIKERVKLSPTTGRPLIESLLEFTDTTEPIVLHASPKEKYRQANWLGHDEVTWTQKDVKILVAVEEFFGE